jgi:hypothetical protein
VGPWRYKPAGEVFDDVTGTLDSPEWEIVPIEPTKDALGVAMGNLNVVPAIGTVRPDVVFAFGTSPSNVESWTDTGDASTLANRAYNLPPGYPDNADVNATVVTWDDAASITDRGLYEAMVSADVQTKDLRQKLVQQHIAVRKVPRRIITFQPIAEDSSLAIEQRRVPRLFADYIVGDVIRFRAVEKFPVTDTSGTVIGTQDVPTVDLLMRVYAAQLDLDDNGVATTTLTLQEDN